MSSTPVPDTPNLDVMLASDPGHPAVSGSERLDSALHAERDRPRLPARLPRFPAWSSSGQKAFHVGDVDAIVLDDRMLGEQKSIAEVAH
jgi:hypothetical protein